MDIRAEVFKVLEKNSGDRIMELSNMSPEEIYKFAEEDIKADGVDVPDFSDLATKEKFFENEPVIGRAMESAAREWLNEKGMDAMRTEILCHIFIMGLATAVVKDEVSKKPILH